MKLKLSELREQRGLTQSEFAAMIGVSAKTEWNWEKGTSAPNAEMIWRMCEYFDTDPNTFMGWYDEHPEDMPKSAPPGLSDDEAVVVESYRSLTPGRRVAARDMLDGLSSGSRGQEADGASYEEAV